MANIIISIHNPLLRIGGRFPYFENFINGLVKYGNKILFFESQNYTRNYGKIPVDILKKLQSFNPDLFIFMNNNFWDISDYFKDVPIVVYDVDSPNVYSDIELLRSNKDRFKYFTITSSGKDLIQEAIGINKENICYIPPFSGVNADRTIEQNINIGFCGNHWLWNDINQFYKFIQSKPTEKERETAKKVYQEYKVHPTKTFSQLYHNYDVKNRLTADDLYTFSVRVSGIERLRYLTAIADLGLEVRGNHWNAWQPLLSVFPEVLLSYSHEPVNNLITTQNFYNRCKIGFNTNHIQAQNGFSWRVADILASNACLVTKKSDDLSRLGFKLPMYESKEEARELCQKLLNDDTFRQDLVLRSQEIINKNHRFENILPVMEEFLNLNLRDASTTGSIEIFDIDTYKDSQNSDAKNKQINTSSDYLTPLTIPSIWKYFSNKFSKNGVIDKNNQAHVHCINVQKAPFVHQSVTLNFKNKIRYKIWKHLCKKISKKGPLSREYGTTFVRKIHYKIWKYLNKKLLKKGIIQQIGITEFQKQELLTEKLIQQLRRKYRKYKKIKVAFLHMYITSDQYVLLFDKMLKSKIFDPYWIVNPDVLRSKENFDFQYKRTKDTLIDKYGKERVLDGYDYETGNFIDYTSQFDLATTSNPYEEMADKLFQIKYWAKKVPMFYISYFYMGRCFVSIMNLKNPQFNYFWKIFVENQYVKKLAQTYQTVKGKNMLVTGYSKLDLFDLVKKEQYNRKRIIIAPHHSIDNNDTSVGNFLSYCDSLLKLPKKFPEIDFIYRPHPMLEEKLNKLWGKNKVKEWLETLLKNKNVIYSTDGEYQDLFVNSDALIHDCGSFSAEYLCTGHPCAYFIKKTADYNKIHTELGHKCINSHYLINSEQDLSDFITNVVIKGNDSKKEERLKFAHKELMVNYPHVTDTILNILTQEIKGHRK